MDLITFIKTLIFPERCPYCGCTVEPERIACDSCLETIKEKHKAIKGGAGGCRCVSTFAYGGKVRRMILRMKYRNRTQYIPQIAVIMADDIRGAYDCSVFDAITFVPMHKKDLNERGYNQSELLAKALSKELSLPCLDTLEKVKHTPKQHNLTLSQRRKNLIGAFKVRDKEAVKGKNLLIVDDIVTSGSTLEFCCKALNKAKPGIICCATIAAASNRYDKDTVI